MGLLTTMFAAIDFADEWTPETAAKTPPINTNSNISAAVIITNTPKILTPFRHVLDVSPLPPNQRDFRMSGFPLSYGIKEGDTWLRRNQNKILLGIVVSTVVYAMKKGQDCVEYLYNEHFAMKDRSGNLIVYRDWRGEDLGF